MENIAIIAVLVIAAVAIIIGVNRKTKKSSGAGATDGSKKENHE